MIAWFIRNGVAANLLMLLILAGGILGVVSVNVRMFPKLDLRTVTVNVVYPGAAPEEVERSLVLPIEEAVQGLEGIKELRSEAQESIGTVFIEAERGYSMAKLKENVKTRVDAIITFPAEAERAIVDELVLAEEIIRVAIVADTDQITLRRIAAQARDDLLRLPGISQVKLDGLPDLEIAIEVDEETLRRYGLTFEEVANAVRRSSNDFPGGSVKTTAAEILLRVKQQAYTGEAFEDLVLRASPDGTRITLGDVATVRDAFVDSKSVSLFDGKPAAFLVVYAVGNETPIDVSAKVNQFVEDAGTRYSDAIQFHAYVDGSFYLRGRLKTMLVNGGMGFLLVMVVLTLFLRPSLAFFVALGIPFSFLGTLFVMPIFGISINIISLFAFILVLGIVVDDAIVVGESVFSEFQRHGHSLESAARGAEYVALPVVFAVLTTMVAFVPLLVVPGFSGDFFAPIAGIVILTLFWSLVQSKMVLPYHLTFCRVGKDEKETSAWLLKIQRAIANGLETFVKRFYEPALHVCLRFRYVTVALFVGLLLITLSLVKGGWVKFIPFPVVPSDYIVIQLQMPVGTSLQGTSVAAQQIRDAYDTLLDDLEKESVGNIGKHISVSLGGNQGFDQRQIGSASNRAVFVLELTKSEQRTLSAVDLANRWRECIGVIPGVKSMQIIATAALNDEKPINVQLAGGTFEDLLTAKEEVMQTLRTYKGVFDVTDNYSGGKLEMQMKVKPDGEALGVTAFELGSQVRQAFYGAEAERIIRGRDEIKVMVRYPRSERDSLADLENLRIRLPDGRAVAFDEVAEIQFGESYTTINRMEQERVVNITADADKESVDVQYINATLTSEIIPKVLQGYPGVKSTLKGEAKSNAEMLESLSKNGVLALIVIYGLLAIPFRSYLQPFIVMSVIPFGLIGAIGGHFFTGQSLSTLSLFGIVALTGVVVNDSLVLVDYVNKEAQKGVVVLDAAWAAGARRFRPIILTSLTTFAGLIPILLEKSLQAQFLIPMATSLGFGVIFATFITLLLVPALYLILSDIKWLARAIGGFIQRQF